MTVFLGALIGVLGVVLAYRRFRDVTRPARPEDLGAVSEDWCAQRRRFSDEL